MLSTVPVRAAYPTFLVSNLAHAVSLHYMHYNFARSHKSLGRGVTPAMAAGVAEYPWTVWDIAGLLD
jgi:hypothetical protein